MNTYSSTVSSLKLFECVLERLWAGINAQHIFRKSLIYGLLYSLITIILSCSSFLYTMEDLECTKQNEYIESLITIILSCSSNEEFDKFFALLQKWCILWKGDGAKFIEDLLKRMKTWLQDFQQQTENLEVFEPLEGSSLPIFFYIFNNPAQKFIPVGI